MSKVIAHTLLKRINQLKKLREETLQKDPKTPVTNASYQNLLDFHIPALEEIRKVIGMIVKDDMKALQEWANERNV